MAKRAECSLTGDTLEKAKRELNEDPDTRHIEVQNLAKRLQKVSGLKPCVDYQFLIKFLRARKFEQERAFEMVKHYYEVRQTQREIFDDLKPSRVKHILDAGAIEVLNGRDAEGAAVVVIRPGSLDPDRYDIIDVPKTMYLVLNFITQKEDVQVNGVHIINNMEGFTMKHAARMGPSLAKTIASVLQKVVPMRFRKLDYVNEPTFFDLVFGLVKPFLQEKILSRIRMNGSCFDNLLADINPDILPKDLGGNVEPHSDKGWITEFLAAEQTFVEDNKYGFVKMDVEKGKKGSKTENADMSGLGGTFKKLDI